MTVCFLIAGMQKAATSALWNFLRQHPRLYLPPAKELHYFDNEQVDWRHPAYDRTYHVHFRDARPGQLWGEATPIYTFWPPSLERIRAYRPDMKLIVSLREPVMRAYSHWRMEVVRGKETLPFAEAIREGRARSKSGTEFPGYHRVYSYVERSYYAPQLRRLLAAFSRDQLMFLSPADLRRQHRETLDDICGFLGVPRFDRYPEPRMVHSLAAENVPPLDPADASYLQQLFRDDLRQSEALTGCRIARACEV